MPAAKQNKRPASTAKVPKAAAKKPRQERQDPLLEGVLEGIKQAEDLPESVHTMLAAVAPGALQTPMVERHEAQGCAVRWIEDTLKSVHAKLQAATDSKAAAVAESNDKRGTLEGAVAEAEAAVRAQQAAGQAKKDELDEASKAVATAMDALAESQKLQAAGDAAYVVSKKEKETIEAALEECAKPLKAGSCTADEVRVHVARLSPLAVEAGLDDSLTTALPMSAAKGVGERGTFDVMVMDGLEGGLQAKVAKLAQIVADGTPEAEARAKVVEEAQAQLVAASERQGALAREAQGAEAAKKQAEASLAAAKEAVASWQPHHEALLAACEAARSACENFAAYNVGCFQMLKEKETEAAEAAKKEAAAAARKEAAAALEETEETVDVATAGA